MKWNVAFFGEAKTKLLGRTSWSTVESQGTQFTYRAGCGIQNVGWVVNTVLSPPHQPCSLFPVPGSRFPVFPDFVFWCDLVAHDKDWRKYCSCMPNFSKCPLQFKAKIPVCNIRVNPLFIIHIETFGWNLHAVVLWNKFRLAYCTV